MVPDGQVCAVSCLVVMVVYVSLTSSLPIKLTLSLDIPSNLSWPFICAMVILGCVLVFSLGVAVPLLFVLIRWHSVLPYALRKF